MQINLKMLKVLILGGSRGIGLEIAKALHSGGVVNACDITLVARCEKTLKVLQEKYGFKILALDVMSEFEKLKEYLLKDTPNVIVHNIGGRLACDNQALSYESWRKSMEFNMGISVRVNEILLPIFAEAKGGIICHISSNAAIDGSGAPGYVAAKAAINAYVKSSARFYAKDNVRIFAVMPGIIESEVWQDKAKLNPQYVEQRKAEQPLGRFAYPIEIGEFVASLIVMNNPLCNGAIYTLTGGV